MRTKTKAYKFYISCFEKELIPLNLSYNDFIVMLKQMLSEVKND